METENVYKQKMSAQLKEWGAQMSLLEAKMENMSADMKLKRTAELKDLQEKQEAAKAKMEELGKASGEAWTQMTATADKMWADLKTGLAEMQAKFK
jgi:hypothetical protein